MILNEDLFKDYVVESLKNEKNITRNKKIISEDSGNNGKWYVTLYQEQMSDDVPVGVIQSFKEFNSEQEAKDYMKEQSQSYITKGLEKITPEFYLKRSALSGNDEFVILENELGSEE